MTDYNAIAEVAVRPTSKRADAWITALAPYSPAIGRAPRGNAELVITVPAKSLEQAATTALALLLRAAGDLERFEVITTAEFDRRTDDVAVPDLVGATEAAELIGITRQRVQQMASTGALPSAKVGGKSLVFPRAVVEQVAALRAAGKTVDG